MFTIIVVTMSPKAIVFIFCGCITFNLILTGESASQRLDLEQERQIVRDPATSFYKYLTRTTVDDPHNPSPNDVPQEPTSRQASGLGITLGGTKVISASGLLKPQVEVLKLVEAFLKLKGELIARAYAVFSDNWDIIRSLIHVIINKIPTLHSFTVTGIVVLRKILEFAAHLFGEWKITLPEINLGVSAGLLGRSPHPAYDSSGNSYSVSNSWPSG